jgi:hypothetical protein
MNWPWSDLRYYLGVRLEGLTETTKRLSKDSLYSGQDTERATPEHKLLPELPCTVML